MKLLHPTRLKVEENSELDNRDAERRAGLLSIDFAPKVRLSVARLGIAQNKDRTANRIETSLAQGDRYCTAKAEGLPINCVDVFENSLAHVRQLTCNIVACNATKLVQLETVN